jgi:serine/threonine protein kinase/tetratricopeptide (TPR) repeat protein
MKLSACARCGRDGAVPTHGVSITLCMGCQTALLDEAATALTLSTQSEDVLSAFREIPLTPEFLNSYQLVRILGRGGMGLVFEAQDRARSTRVAIKFLSEVNSEKALRRFVKEGEMMAAIQNANVVRVFTVSDLKSHPYLVTEYLDGGTLRQRLKVRGTLTLREALTVTSDCLAGLTACHERGIVHRDLKPENILFTGGGVAKIADLGIAKDYGDSAPVTALGDRLGTPLYMAPEQLRGDPAGVGSDLYAMGLILAEMLTGKCPLAAPNVYALLAKRSMEVPTLEDGPQPLPEGLVAIAKRALAVHMDDRYTAPSDFAADVARALRSLERGEEMAPPARHATPIVNRTYLGGRPEIATPRAGIARLGSQITASATRSVSRVIQGLHYPVLWISAGLAAALSVGFLMWHRGGAAGNPNTAVVLPSPRATPPARWMAWMEIIRRIERNVETGDQRLLPLGLEGGAVSYCPLVLPSSKVRVALRAAALCQVVEINQQPVLPVGQLVLQANDARLHVGLNWITLRTSGNGVPTGTAELESQPVPLPTGPTVEDAQLVRFDKLCSLLFFCELEMDRLSSANSLLEEEKRKNKSTWPGLEALVDVRRTTADVYLAEALAGGATESIVLQDNRALGVIKRSLDLMQKDLVVAPERVDGWFAMGYALRHTGNADQARTALVRALAAWPGCPWAWYELARVERVRAVKAMEDPHSKATAAIYNQTATQYTRNAIAALEAYHAAPEKEYKSNLGIMNSRARELAKGESPWWADGALSGFATDAKKKRQ